MRLLRTSLFAGVALALLIWSPAHATRIQEVVSPGGIKAWLVHEPSIPMIALEIAFRGGAVHDPQGKEGLANFLSGLLDEGAGDMESLDFQRRLEELAIGLSFSAGRDFFNVEMKTLSKNREQAFNLLGLALTQPRFDPDPLERVRRQIETMLTRDLEDPNRIARRTWMQTVFPDHPYGRPVRGTLDSIARIDAGDLRSFTAARFGRDEMIVGVVGDLEPEELGRLLDRALGRLPARAAHTAIPDARPSIRTETRIIRKKNPQSVVVLGAPGLKRDDPDYYAGYVMNAVLGGSGFSSRLMEEVREKRGLAYGVYSYLYPLDYSALWLGGVGTANGRVAESVRIIRAELARMAADGVTDEELADVKTYLNGSFPLQLSSNARIAGILIAIQTNDLGIDYIDRRAGLISAVTREDVQRVAKRIFTDGGLLIVVVGDPEHLEEDG